MTNTNELNYVTGGPGNIAPQAKSATQLADELRNFISDTKSVINIAKEDIKDHESLIKTKVSAIKTWEKQIKRASAALHELNKSNKPKKDKKAASKTNSAKKKEAKPQVAHAK